MEIDPSEIDKNVRTSVSLNADVKQVLDFLYLNPALVFRPRNRWFSQIDAFRMEIADQIIPAQFLKGIDKTGLGENLFFHWCYNADGSPNPDFILNKEDAVGAGVLVAGDNFGCGSSREHAVWGLMDRGFQAVISTSFADIFCNNSLENGLLPVIVDSKTHLQLQKLIAEDPDCVIKIEMKTQTMTLPDGRSVEFPIDRFRKNCIMQGVDQLGCLRTKLDSIDSYEEKHVDRINTLEQ